MMDIKILFVLLVLSVVGLSYMIYDRLLDDVVELPYYGPRLENGEGELIYHEVYLGDIILIDQNNLLHESFLGKGDVVVANFFFTSCPSICPKMMTSLAKVNDHFKETDQIRYMSVTVDPKRDSPDRLHSYAEDRSIDYSRWRLLTGDKKELYALARNAFYLVATDGDGGPTDFIHSEKLVLIDQDNHLRGYYDGTEVEAVDQLIHDISRLLNDGA